MIRALIDKLGSEGIAGPLRAIARKFHPYPYPARCFRDCRRLLRRRVGLEIGGPSTIFSRRNFLPLYPVVANLDNCNFSSRSVWEGIITPGLNFYYDPKRRPGRQYLLEATDLSEITSGKYDFVLSSHTLEHVANPIRALEEWRRVLKNDGILVLVLPHRDGTFDHGRPVTPLSHLVGDFQKNVGEDDLTHLQEILRLHDLERDPLAGSFEKFRKRSINNFQNRCLHHHVFDTALACSLLDYVGFRILAVEILKAVHIITVSRKPRAWTENGSRSFLGDDAPYRRRSIFPSDQASRSSGQGRSPLAEFRSTRKGGRP